MRPLAPTGGITIYMKKITKQNIDDVFKSKECTIETAELKGYELIKEFFVDSSGWGSPTELALTVDQFKYQLNMTLDHHKTIYTCLTNVGQFQVYVGAFIKNTEKSKERTVEKIKGNTLEITTPNKRVIRLYDTDIITFQNNKITFDTGGFNTNTTFNRMNEFGANGIKIYRRNYEPYAEYNGKVYPFQDNKLTITL